MNILLTGATGNLGAATLQALQDHSVRALVRDLPTAQTYPDLQNLPHVTLWEGNFSQIPQELSDWTEAIVHLAADTRFKAPLETLRLCNVEGTRALLSFAESCPNYKKFVHISTACVCGDQEGRIPESPLERPQHFINAYEASKWEAENVVFASALPSEIVRLSIVIGDESQGEIQTLGALHHLLYWLWKGLIPMVPGQLHTPVDVISTDYAARVIATALEAEPTVHRVWHGVAGHHSPTLEALLDTVASVFTQHSSAWSKGVLQLPEVVDASTYRSFEHSVTLSRDALFLKILEDSNAFLPGLLHPRLHDTAQTERLGLSAYDTQSWQTLVTQTTRHVLQRKS